MNYKVKKKHWEECQKYLFNLGFRWQDSEREIIEFYSKSDYQFITIDVVMRYSSRCNGDFIEYSNHMRESKLKRILR